MSIEGQGHFFTIYFPGFVCFVLYLAKISGERLQDHWSSGSDQFRNIIIRHICIGYDLNYMRQSACLVIHSPKRWQSKNEASFQVYE